ncbi:hypothetical protein M2403_002003 [Rahnella sp. BIGb0603]|uniref:hypothetical protein n=1 Tax=Rahnella sp. BIGb0603 TaxID=2940612 RepID=UPI0021680AFF|nr:hypothetical protein [Rahnella sp. BIGb0603]MCS3423402.1 hypothetical protein [Rahnella sp. BIGb0603]
MNITFECADVKISGGTMGRGVKLTVEGAELNYVLPDKEMLAFMDEENIREYMESLGYLVVMKQEDAA